ncbi:SDR family oxidoreductase [Streptomyces sp. NPDC054904]|uniref:SDR family oxidoreductase n=1 Tax=Streptomyces sp. NPDC090054 TaxID=3365933 RepID=UPI0038276F10
MLTDAGLRVLVTGAGRGIGRQTALALARRRCDLVLVARSEGRLREVAGQARAAGAANVHVVPTDLADPEATVRAWLTGWRLLGGLDVLINNAGFNTRRAPIEAYSLAEWDSLLAVNLRAPFLLSQQAVRDMAAGGSGHIVNVLSTAAHTAIPFMAPYVAAKAGLLAMTRVLALEANRHGIRVSTVSPGATDSAGTGEERAMRPESVGAVIAATVFAPPDVMAAEIIVRPTALDG